MPPSSPGGIKGLVVVAACLLPAPSTRAPHPSCLQVTQADIKVGKSYIHAINRVLVPGTQGIRH